ncbi:Atrial natriuretic peptide clearance receptor [Plakobranchus ocellatus]|uniref:Atrial natriuretic peptide clearance receptor n=1 Tax=Plakobranchus ocellatus TaxID=259542 RepID=A0AAV4DFZ0_9GAST|nr:Atrial natriuretic peptide clearance receptor [Plakobranchus ocellatus]
MNHIADNLCHIAAESMHYAIKDIRGILTPYFKFETTKDILSKMETEIGTEQAGEYLDQWMHEWMSQSTFGGLLHYGSLLGLLHNVASRLLHYGSLLGLPHHGDYKSCGCIKYKTGDSQRKTQVSV